MRVGLGGVWVALLVIWTGTAWSQGYPTKPVRIIVGFVPGGGVDTTARMVGQALGDLWGSSVIIENRPGAAGNVGTEYAAKAPPDGYTLVLCNIATHEPILSKLTADLHKVLAGPLKQRLEDQGVAVAPTTPEQFVAHVKIEIEKWTKVVIAAKLESE